MPRYFFSETACIVVVSLLVSAAPGASEPAKTKSKNAATPKIVAVTYKSAPDDGNTVLMVETQIKQLAGRGFLVGKIVVVKDQIEFEGKLVWIPVNQISRLIEFATKEEAIKIAKIMDQPNTTASACLIELAPVVQVSTDVPQVSLPADEESASAAIDWRTNYEHARQEAKETKRPLFLFFGRISCQFSELQASILLGDPTIAKLLNDEFVPVKIDGDRDAKLVQSLQIECYPTMIFATVEGKIMGTVEGVKPPERMLEAMHLFLKQSKREEELYAP